MDSTSADRGAQLVSIVFHLRDRLPYQNQLTCMPYYTNREEMNLFLIKLQLHYSHIEYLDVFNILIYKGWFSTCSTGYEEEFWIWSGLFRAFRIFLQQGLTWYDCQKRSHKNHQKVSRKKSLYGFGWGHELLPLGSDQPQPNQLGEGVTNVKDWKLLEHQFNPFKLPMISKYTHFHPVVTNL